MSLRGPDQGRSGASSQAKVEVQCSSLKLVECMLVRRGSGLQGRAKLMSPRRVCVFNCSEQKIHEKDPVIAVSKKVEAHRQKSEIGQGPGPLKMGCLTAPKRPGPKFQRSDFYSVTETVGPRIDVCRIASSRLTTSLGGNFLTSNMSDYGL